MVRVVKFKSYTDLKNPIRGFSLIELSVLIAVAAASVVAFLSWTEPKLTTESSKTAETRIKMERVVLAIEEFRVEKGRLPCPGDPKIRSNNTYFSGTDTYPNNFGVEDLDSSQSDLTLGIDCPNNIGSIPVFSLNLNADDMYDAWGRKFTYHVSKNFCYKDSGTTIVTPEESAAVGCTARDYNSGLTGTPVGDIIVTNGASTNLTTTAAFVILSYGVNGLGANTVSGDKISTTGSTTDELENSNSDDTYVLKDISSSFDDILIFRTKTQIENLVKDTLMKMVSGSECQLISQAIASINKTSALTMNSIINDYEIVGPQSIYNKGENVVMGLLWGVQTACAQYYGTNGAGSPDEDNSGAPDWSGAQCPGGGTYNGSGGGASALTNNNCTCADRSWDGAC